MSLLTELKTIMISLSIPVETGVFKDTAPDRYTVLTPLVDTYDLFTDNMPGQDIQEVRISLFDKGNYLAVKSRIETAVLSAGITVTERRYIGHDDNTGYHQYAIDVAKNYYMEET